MTTSASSQLVRLAEHTLFEYIYAPEHERLPRVGHALMLCVDYALDHGLIGREDPSLPAYLDPLLTTVYAYLGDPL